MNKTYWALLTINQEITPTGYTIVCTTDVPCHLFMRWTLITPKQHKIPVLRRGIFMHTDKYFCFDVYTDNEQEEAGDTYIHTFIKEPWAVCETRYFYFHGTIDGIASPSTSAIFKKHRPEYVPTQWFFAYEPDYCPAVVSNAWVVIDSVLGGKLKDLLPPEAKVAFLHFINVSGAEYFGVRPTGSTHTENAWILSKSHMWLSVALDENKTFEAWFGNHLYQELWLMGYATEGAVVMFDNPIPKTPQVLWDWETFDLSTECPDAIAIFCETGEESQTAFYGFRKHGSTDNRRASIHHNWPVIGCNQSQKIEVSSYAWDELPPKFYITGYIKKSANFYTNAPDKSLDIIASYQTITLDPGPHLAFFEIWAPTVAAKLAFRAFGSEEDIFKEPNYRHSYAITPLDTEGRLEAKIENTDTDFFLLGTGT